jgi:hypothetical protein
MPVALEGRVVEDAPLLVLQHHLRVALEILLIRLRHREIMGVKVFPAPEGLLLLAVVVAQVQLVKQLLAQGKVVQVEKDFPQQLRVNL